jgi:hypothetical protein
MSPEKLAPEQTLSRWFVDLAWYEQNNRSFLNLAQQGLCAKCVEKLGKKKKKYTQNDVITAVKDCCSKSPEFITSKMPLLESIFRVILANGNEPMNIEEIGKQLTECRGDAYSVSTQILTRLLDTDRWYGFKQIKE